MDRREIPHFSDYLIDRAGRVFLREVIPVERDRSGRYRLRRGGDTVYLHPRDLLAVAYPEEPFPKM